MKSYFSFLWVCQRRFLKASKVTYLPICRFIASPLSSFFPLHLLQFLGSIQWPPSSQLFKGGQSDDLPPTKLFLLLAKPFLPCHDPHMMVSIFLFIRSHTLTYEDNDPLPPEELWSDASSLTFSLLEVLGPGINFSFRLTLMREKSCLWNQIGADMLMFLFRKYSFYLLDYV